MSQPKCTCPYTDPKYWLSAASLGYGSGYEPGSTQEWDPECPVHQPDMVHEGRAYLFRDSPLWYQRNEVISLPVEWPEQRWPRAQSPVIAEAVEQARRDLQASLTRSLDAQCVSLGLDAYKTWRWPHTNEVERARYQVRMAFYADAAIGLGIIDPKDYLRVTTVPF